MSYKDWHPWPEKGTNPEFDEKRKEWQRKGGQVSAEKSKKRAEVRRMLREDPNEIYESALSNYFEENPEYLERLTSVLMEELIKDPSSRAVGVLKDIFGMGVDKSKKQTKKPDVQSMSKDEIAAKIKEFKLKDGTND